MNLSHRTLKRKPVDWRVDTVRSRKLERRDMREAAEVNKLRLHLKRRSFPNPVFTPIEEM